MKARLRTTNQSKGRRAYREGDVIRRRGGPAEVVLAVNAAGRIVRTRPAFPVDGDHLQDHDGRQLEEVIGWR